MVFISLTLIDKMVDFYRMIDHLNQPSIRLLLYICIQNHCSLWLHFRFLLSNNVQSIFLCCTLVLMLKENSPRMYRM